MATDDLERTALRLGRFADDLADGGPIPTTDPDLDPALAATVRGLYRLNQGAAPTDARTRVWRELVDDVNMPKTVVPVPVPVVADALAVDRNPRPRPTDLAPAGPLAWPSDGRRSVRRRWALAQLATAAVLVLAFGSLFLTFGPGRRAFTPGGQRAVTPATTAAGDAWMHRGNPARTGAMPGPAPTGVPVVRWRFASARGGMVAHGSVATPALVDGVLYVGSWDNHLYAVDAATGRERWRFLTGGMVVSSPTIVDGVVYFGSGDGNLYAVAAATGRERWRYAAGDAVDSAPVVVAGTVYVGSGSGLNVGALHAVDAATGTPRWRFATDGALISSPAIVDGVVYVGSGAAAGFAAAPGPGRSVYAVDTRTGHQRWRFPTAAVVGSDPAIVDGVLYAGSVDGTLYALDTATGGERWRIDTGGEFWAAPTVVDGVVYVHTGSPSNALIAVDAGTGQERWRAPTGYATIQLSSPVVLGGVVYVGSRDLNFYAVDAATGEVRWRIPVGAAATTSPIVSDGVIYFGVDCPCRGLSAVGAIYALGDVIPPDGATPATLPP